MVCFAWTSVKLFAQACGCAFLSMMLWAQTYQVIIGGPTPWDQLSMFGISWGIVGILIQGVWDE